VSGGGRLFPPPFYFVPAESRQQHFGFGFSWGGQSWLCPEGAPTAFSRHPCFETNFSGIAEPCLRDTKAGENICELTAA